MLFFQVIIRTVMGNVLVSVMLHARCTPLVEFEKGRSFVAAAKG
jgi:hypothetical protein